MGQTVSIPDTSFARSLKKQYPNIFDASNKLIITKAAELNGDLTCITGHIKDAEGLQYFINISSLHLENNQLENLPNLTSLKRLKYLYLIYNNLRFLPGVENLSELETLFCWRNEIEELPDFINSPNLTNLQAFNNNLKKVPFFGYKPKLTTVYLNDNEITSVTDFSQCPVLSKVRLYNNPLSFKEMGKVKTSDIIDTNIFKFNPQKTRKTAYHLVVKEADSLILSTGLDRGLAGIEYKWFKGENVIYSSGADSMLIAKVSVNDTGSYRCEISYSRLPGVKLVTDYYRIAVESCINTDKLKVTTKEINCLNAGYVIVSSNGEKIEKYELQATASKLKVSNHSGIFEGLSETKYELFLTTSGNCIKKYPGSILLAQKECEEVVISPDEDGQGDSYYFEDIGSVTIYDKRGNIVKSLQIPGKWDGNSNQGKVFSGFYVADINNGKKLIGITVLY